VVNEMFKNGMRPVHPGEVLLEDFLKPLGMSANALRVPAPRINDVVRGRRGVSADTAMRLARYFGGDAGSWLRNSTNRDEQEPCHAPIRAETADSSVVDGCRPQLVVGRRNRLWRFSAACGRITQKAPDTIGRR
jgi:addiction module HigA family antidote